MIEKKQEYRKVKWDYFQDRSYYPGDKNGQNPHPYIPPESLVVPDNTDEFLDRQDVLQMLHISVRTLQNWRTKGVLKHHKLGGKIYYMLHEVQEAAHVERQFLYRKAG